MVALSNGHGQGSARSVPGFHLARALDACRGTRNPTTGMALPMAVQITDDRNGTVRAWMAVLTYLFSDYRFLYQ